MSEPKPRPGQCTDVNCNSPYRGHFVDGTSGLRIRRDYCSTVNQNIRFRLALKLQKRRCSKRHKLSWGEKRQIILRRFGNLGCVDPVGQSYGQIAKALYVRRVTVQKTCDVYVKRGGQLPFKSNNKRPRSLSEQHLAWACDRLTLIDQAALTLPQRCEQLRQRFGVQVHRSTLRNYYKRAGITYRQPLRALATSMGPDLLREHRVRFIDHLLQRIRVGRRIFYFDECTTNLWERSNKRWQPKDGIRIPLCKNQGSNTTILGAMSAGHLFYRLGESTNREVVFKFFEQLAQAYDLRGSVVVLDNHRAHHVEEVTGLLRSKGAETLFLPPATSILNPIEVLWSLVKQRWRKLLASTPPESMGQRWMERQLIDICGSVDPETLGRICHSHLKEARFVLQEAIQHYDGALKVLSPSQTIVF